MEYNMKKIYLFFCLSLLIGCKTGPDTREVMDSWMKSHISELIASCGPPTYTTEDGLGGKIYVYAQDINGYTTPGVARRAKNGDIYYTNPQTYSFQYLKMFYVNEKGII